MRYNRKSDKVRKDGVLQFRLNIGERRKLEELRKETGLSFAKIFRLRVLGEVSPIEGSAEDIREALAEQTEIWERPDLSAPKKKRLAREVRVRRVAAVRTGEGKKRHGRKSA